jgi:hypothetical protein
MCLGGAHSGRPMGCCTVCSTLDEGVIDTQPWRPATGDGDGSKQSLVGINGAVERSVGIDGAAREAIPGAR